MSNICHSFIPSLIQTRVLTHSISAFYHSTIVDLFRPLQENSEISLDYTLVSPRHVCYEHCIKTMEIMSRYRSAFSFKYMSPMAVFAGFATAFTLVAQLEDGPHTHLAFAQAVQMLVEGADNFKINGFLVKMLKALLQKYGSQIPKEAERWLEDFNFNAAVLDDLPTDVPIPISHPGNAENRDGEVKYEGLGELMAQFNESMSLDMEPEVQGS